MRYLTQSKFAITLEDLISHINRTVGKSGYKEFKTEDVENLHIAYSDEHKKANEVHIVFKESRPLFF